jgi:hypothetical protein
VIQRVKKMPGVGPPAGTPENTRTWSMAITTITAPRTMSTEVKRCAVRAVAGPVPPAETPDDWRLVLMEVQSCWWDDGASNSAQRTVGLAR